jgi:hypothetical protein
MVTTLPRSDTLTRAPFRVFGIALHMRHGTVAVRVALMSRWGLQHAACYRSPHPFSHSLLSVPRFDYDKEVRERGERKN